MRVAGTTFLVGGLALAGLPPFGTWAGQGGVRDGVRRRARGVAGAGRGPRVGADRWRGPARGAADLRSVSARFPTPGRTRTRSRRATAGRAGTPGASWRRRSPCSWWRRRSPCPRVWRRAAARAGAAMIDRPTYVGLCCTAPPGPHPAVSAEPFWHLSAVGSACSARCSRSRSRSPASGRVVDPRPSSAPLIPVRRAVAGSTSLHRAHVGDYVSWVLVGFTVLGATLLLG